VMPPIADAVQTVAICDSSTNDGSTDRSVEVSAPVVASVMRNKNPLKMLPYPTSIGARYRIKTVPVGRTVAVPEPAVWNGCRGDVSVSPTL